jgi:uncharacterized membrane protein
MNERNLRWTVVAIIAALFTATIVGYFAVSKRAISPAVIASIETAALLGVFFLWRRRSKFS